MTGLFFLTVVGLWLWVSVVITRKMLRRVPGRLWRTLGGIVMYCALLAAPVADEILGGIQFRAMCKQEALLTINPDLVRGKNLKRTGVRIPVTKVAIKIERWRENFVDIETGNVLASYVWLRAEGGWLIRLLHISEGDAPLLINPATCNPGDEVKWSKIYGFSIVDN